MKFEMTTPCSECPFRTDIRGYLRPGRSKEIISALLSGQTFSCHKTNEYLDGEVIETHITQHCAGALIFLEKNERPNQMMRWMERIGMYDRDKLDMEAPVVASYREMEAIHTKQERR